MRNEQKGSIMNFSTLKTTDINPAISHLFIVKPMTRFSLQSWFSTHPPTAERVARLRQMAATVSSAAQRIA